MQSTEIVNVYQGRIRTGVIGPSRFPPGRLWAPTYRWGYRDGSTAAEWFRGANVEAEHQRMIL